MTAPGAPGATPAPSGDLCRPSIEPIVTERLLMRPLTVGDASFVLEILNDPSFRRFVGDKGVTTIEDARNYIMTGPLDSYRQFGFGLLLVQLRNDDVPIGLCGLLKRDALDDVDLGFAILPAFRSRGYASECAAAMLKHGHTTLALQRLLAVVSPENHASRRVLTGLGFCFERKVRLSPTAPEIDLLASHHPPSP